MARFNKSTSLTIVLLLLTLFLIHKRLELRQDIKRYAEFTKNRNINLKRYPPDGEKFITYLPHSGLHNQRVALINSVILAKALNRTLIMPELNLGTGTYWRPSTYLPYRLDECGDFHAALRRKTEDGKPWWSPDCFDYRNYLPMAVDSIFDLTAVHQMGVKTIQRRDMQLDYFERYWSVPLDDRNTSLVYQVKDNIRYSYQIVDDPSIDKSTKFPERYTLQQLAQQQYPFMMFNSLFGSDRLALRSSQWIQTRDHLRKEMGVRQPWVVNRSRDIITRLGGPGSYISVHIRMGDGIFKEVMEETMERVRQKLNQLEQQQQEEDMIGDDDENDASSAATIAYIQSLQEQPEQRLAACLRLQQHPHPRRLALIYMTTDASSPRSILPHLFDEFVCLFTLGDFKDIVDDTLALQPALMDHRHQSHHNQEGEEQSIINASLPPPIAKGKIFIPLIDAEVAAQGSLFVPTARSTFSAYIGFRNKRFHHMKNSTTNIVD
ncbi:hypothetical protein BCR42DRAFT_451318 [Absidia repens]|uniref:GDP-fucose protein O-fucosyltransferase-domain-containing protein n=1 Tax=Absidia repens TaxID=90262 RepID=A0A1X2IH10_9FUNG|nr:hypothetical protein BCR42DRAFT_451318 [Absidia repens]